MEFVNLYSVDILKTYLPEVDNKFFEKEILENFEKNNYANIDEVDSFHGAAYEDCALKVSDELKLLSNCMWKASKEYIEKLYPKKPYNLFLDISPKAHAIWGHLIAPKEQSVYHNHDELGDIKYLNLSAVYYVKVPENSGDLVFNPYTHKHMWLERIKPEEKMLVVFPSWIPHYTLKNKSNEVRISIGANLIVREAQ